MASNNPKAPPPNLPRGQHDILSLQQFTEHIRLAAAEPFLTLALADRGDIHPGELLDLLIGIQELALQKQRQPPAHRTLPGPHRPDQHDVLHGGHAYAGARSKKSSGGTKT